MILMHVSGGEVEDRGFHAGDLDLDWLDDACPAPAGDLANFVAALSSPYNFG